MTNLTIIQTKSRARLSLTDDYNTTMPLHCIALMAIPYSMHISELGNTSVMWARASLLTSLCTLHISLSAVDCDYQHCIVMQGSIPRCISHCSHCCIISHHITHVAQSWTLSQLSQMSHQLTTLTIWVKIVIIKWGIVTKNRP